jgi:predicted TIM-barrel enzyme
MNCLKEIPGTEKPTIARCHWRVILGESYYDSVKGIKKILQKIREDLHSLQKGGVNTVMFSNEYSLPYLTKVRPKTTAAIARIIGEVQQNIKVPCGKKCHG